MPANFLHLFSRIFSWWVGFCLLVVTPLLFPSLKIVFFTPYLVFLIYRTSLYRSLWGGLLCGVVIDLFSNSYFFGLEAFLHTCTIALIYRFRIALFEDRLFTFPFMSYLFVMVITALHYGILIFLGAPLALSATDLLKELFIAPLLESAYTFLVLIIPLRWIPSIFTFFKPRQFE